MILAAGAVMLFAPLAARAQNITLTQGISTVAGVGGTYGYSGDDGAATSAKLYYPFGVAVDSAGNLYIADSENGVIRKVNAGGIISTVAGNGTGGYSGDSPIRHCAGVEL
jgi:hypothetical protein